jgi:RNA polymerase sigma factor (sigma-70 family)
LVGVNIEAASERGRRVVGLKSEEAAFESLFKAEYGRVASIANRVLADTQEAEDVAQEVFINFHRLHSATAEFAAPWLHRAAAHAALNRLRGRRRRQLREQGQAMGESAEGLDPQRVAEVNEDRRRVSQALAKLPPKPASVLVLRSSGLSYAEVAQALGIRTGQIGTLLKRAEAALRKEVNRGTSE